MNPLTTTALRIAAANLRRRIASGGGLSHAEMRALAAVLDEAVGDDGPVQRGVAFVDFVLAPAWVPTIVPGVVRGI